MSTRDIIPPKKGQASLVIKILWMHGMSIGNIANVCGRSRGSVMGITTRAFPKARDEMTIEERQVMLDGWKASNLPEGYFVAQPLAPSQAAKKVERKSEMKPLSAYKKKKPVAEVLPEPDPFTKEGRKEIHKRKMEDRHQEKVEQQEREKREAGLNEDRGVQSAALEFLHERNLLADPDERKIDAKRSDSLSSRERRKEAGRILRSYIDGCRIGGLSGIDYEKIGSGGGSQLAIPAYRLQCIYALGAIKRMMTATDYRLIESVVDHDIFVWKFLPPGAARSAVYEDIRRSLDVVAVYGRMIDRSDFAERWGVDLPFVEHFSRDDAFDLRNRAIEVLRQAK